MMKLREILTITAMGSLMTIGLSSKAEAFSIFSGSWPTPSCLPGTEAWCSFDPPPGRFFEGRVTVRYNQNLFSINEVGWFGELSDQPQTPPPDTGEGPFIDPDVSFELLPPNPLLETEVCFLSDECGFDITESLILPGSEFPIFIDPRPGDDILAVNFKAISPDGLQINSREDFNFFGLTYELTEEANDTVGFRAVPLGTGDFGLVPNVAFNTIICTPASSEEDVPISTCGQEAPPLDFALITQSVINEDSDNPEFVCNANTNGGFFSNGDPFQLFNSSCPGETVDEPQNSWGLLLLGIFGTNLALKHRRKRQKDS